MRGKKLGLTFFWIFLVIAALFLWTETAEKKAHYTPEYERVDLRPFLEKNCFERGGLYDDTLPDGPDQSGCG